MSNTSRFHRVGVAGCLLLAGVLSVVWTELQPPFPDGSAARLAAIDEAGTSAAVSAAVFVVSQLPMLVAVLGIAQLARRGAPVLSRVGAVLAVIGVFGHTVFGGMNLVTVLMAGDAGNRALYAGLLDQVESSPVMAFAAAGLLGTVLGFVVLGAALWRSRAVPRWVPGLLWAFVVVEFVGTGLSSYATYVSGVCFLIAFGALARYVWQSGDTERPARSAPEPAAAAA
jgi:hypothetical protein